eukprot:gb/GEZN01020713.1/.p1 GENE.gb/GEZN01020713.1/~~gb/GEZN01020713.1/.p1  ORF type:complete len:114 (+),score=3.30 gb/GEZN01020713.1/:260-601(+)
MGVLRVLPTKDPSPKGNREGAVVIAAGKIACDLTVSCLPIRRLGREVALCFLILALAQSLHFSVSPNQPSSFRCPLCHSDADGWTHRWSVGLWLWNRSAWDAGRSSRGVSPPF